MLALDTSALVDFFRDNSSKLVQRVETALSERLAVLPPVVVSELLSDFHIRGELRRIILGIPMLEIQEGFWIRTGELRAKVLRRRRKARLADTLIAQVCIDHGVPLIAADRDFEIFAIVGGLMLVS